MAKHLLTEDSNAGVIPHENGQRCLRIWVGLSLEEGQVAQAKLTDPSNQLPRLFPGSRQGWLSKGSVIVLQYGDDHPFGDAPITTRNQEEGVVVLGDLCAVQATEVLSQL